MQLINTFMQADPILSNAGGERWWWCPLACADGQRTASYSYNKALVSVFYSRIFYYPAFFIIPASFIIFATPCHIMTGSLL